MLTMPTQKLNLTRDQLATFLNSHEQIKRFERLFQIVDEVAPSSDTPGINIEAGSTMAAANDSIGKIILLAQEMAVSDAANDGKSAQALAQIAMLAQDVTASVVSAENKANQAFDLLGKLADTVEGLQMSPPPREFKRARYGQFLDTSTQAAAAINTPCAITFNTTDVSNGVFLGSPSSRVTVDTEGVYNFLFSIQLDKTSGGTGVFWVWPRINGIDVPNSNSQVQIQGNNAEQLVTVGYFFELNANDYVEIMFAVSDASVQAKAFPASGFCPAIPSIILTVSNNIKGVQ